MTADTVKLFAKYNVHVNNEMNKIISALDKNEWEKDFGGHFKNIKSLCSHILIADFTWLKRFANLRAFNYSKHPVFNNNYSLKSTPFETIEEYINKRNELDMIISSFIEEVNQSDLEANFRYKNFKNEDQNRNFGGLIIHVFNHQTHHRGMISLYLEILGKENDFSNLLKLV